MISLSTILGWVFGVYWVLISAVSLKVALQAFKKYGSYKKIENPPPEWSALIRTDYHEWKKGKILLGCILFNPIKFLIMLIFQCTCILIFHIAPTKETIKRK